MYGGDAALFQITLTTCFIFLHDQWLNIIVLVVLKHLLVSLNLSKTEIK